jgi:hypothetical protein
MKKKLLKYMANMLILQRAVGKIIIKIFIAPNVHLDVTLFRLLIINTLYGKTTYISEDYRKLPQKKV